MGGLVMVDALDHIKYSQWPRIVACIAFDTPYLGLSGALYNETEAVVSKVMPLVIRLLSGPKLPFAVPTSLAFISGSTLLATQPEVAAMGLCAVGVLSAYILLSYGPSASASVGVLWKNLEFILVLMQSDLNARLKKVVDRHEAGLVRFNAFYVKCPRAKDEYFVQLPEPDHIAFAYFVAVHNSKQRNAIKGHMTMFNENTNDSFCPLVRDTATLIEGCFE
ncbi:hypothetical protein AX16_007290 [Volvariella volvacea WC 439]|nr:hypothetical protein AX16_007290 [Volvariella volvacea WC 439]